VKQLHCFKVLAAVFALCASLPATAGTFQNPMGRPALPSALAAHRPLLAITSAGKRIVAVGQRGHIVFSDDAGRSWKQASVPVASDLVAVSFPTPNHGWAVGHGGVVLHSADAGATWSKQLDGKQSGQIALRYFEAQAGSGPAALRLLSREKGLLADGGTQPLMDVFFESETSGYVVGAFNRIFRTEDGGKSWTPWMGRTENPNELHFYAIQGGASGIYLAGEQGMVWRLDKDKQRFAAIQTPYKGTFFGLVTDGPETLLAFGMRGSLYRSADAGQTWDRIVVRGVAGITGGALLADGSILIANQAGELAQSRDRARSFTPLTPARRMPYFGVASLEGNRIGLVGSEGVRIEQLHQTPLTGL
jgi:photosystem II stability/assembly factor-like uncharacterized protein